MRRLFWDLRIWQEARVLVREVYLSLSEADPRQRDFSFEGQMQRAGISVMNNIAEGFERDSAKEFVHFLSVAKGSCGEVRSMTYPAEDLQYLTRTRAEALRDRARGLSKGIASFSRHLKEKTRKH